MYMEWEYKTLKLKIVSKTPEGTAWLKVEYQDLEDDTEVELGNLGLEGWELVSVMPIDDPAFLGSSGTKVAIAFFKRQAMITQDGIDEILNLQPKGGDAKAYQVKPVREVIVRYNLSLGD